MAVGAVGGLSLRPVVGWALDTLGRKPTILAGTLVMGLSLLLIGPVESLGPLIYVDRVLFGVGSGTLFAGYFTLVADVIPTERRTEGIALFGVSGLLPLAINPFITETGLEATDLRWVFVAVGVVVFFSLVPLRAVSVPSSAASRDPLSFAGAMRAIRHRPLWPVWLATMIFSGSMACFMTFATVTAQERGATWPAGLWLTYAAGASAVRIVGARLPDRIGATNLVVPAVGSYVLALLVISTASAAGGLAGIGHGYAFPVLASAVVTRADTLYRGASVAMFTALFDLMSLSLSPLLGTLADSAGDTAMYLIAASWALVALGCWVVLEHRLGSLSTTR
jgi:MFS family permease